jgi:hypothetical protein
MASYRFRVDPMAGEFAEILKDSAFFSKRAETDSYGILWSLAIHPASTRRSIARRMGAIGVPWYSSSRFAALNES